MSAPRLSFEAGPSRLEIDADGVVAEVRHAHRSVPVLAQLDLGPATVAGRSFSPGPRRVQVDEDEIDLTAAYGAGLQVELRHGFAVGWTTRIALTSTSTQTLELDRLVLRADWATTSTPWSVCTGSDATLAVLPDPGGPVLAARVTTGSLTAIDDEGLVVGPLTLGPGARWVLRIQWEWYATPADLRRRLPALPYPTVQAVGASVLLPDDLDTAIVLERLTGPADAALDEVDGQHVALSTVPGRHGLELRSARRTTGVAIRWCTKVDEFLTAAADDLLDRPRTRAGVVRLDTVAAALVLQRALLDVGYERTQAAGEALDLFTARRSPDQLRGPEWVVYLTGEFQRLGDPDLLDEASVVLTETVDRARAVGVVPRGLGIAVVRLSVALLIAGLPMGGPVGEVDALVDALAGSAGPSGLLDRSGERLDHEAYDAWLEARLATDQLVGPASEGLLDARRPVGRQEVLSLGRRLGAGLPGTAVRPVPAVDQAHLVAVLRLVPDQLGPSLAADWGTVPAVLADRAGLDLTDRLAGAAVGPAHGWLAIADAPR